MSTTTPALLTTEDVCQALSVGRTTVKEAVRAGDLAVVRIGKSVRFTPEALAAFVAARTVPVSSARARRASSK